MTDCYKEPTLETPSKKVRVNKRCHATGDESTIFFFFLNLLAKDYCYVVAIETMAYQN